MLKIKSKNGVTLIALATIVIVLSILAGTAVYSGVETLREQKLVRFATELDIIQSKVNLIHESLINKDGSYNDEFYLIGIDISSLDQSKIDKINQILGGNKYTDYRFFNKSKIKSDLGLDGIDQEIVINFKTRDVVSITGIRKGNNIYRRLSEVSEKYNVTYIDRNVGQITFDVDIKKVDSFWKIDVLNVKYPGNVNKGTLYYKQSTKTNWIVCNGFSFILDTGGSYILRIIDSAGNEAIRQITLEADSSKKDT